MLEFCSDYRFKLIAGIWIGLYLFKEAKSRQYVISHNYSGLNWRNKNTASECTSQFIYLKKRKKRQSNGILIKCVFLADKIQIKFFEFFFTFCNQNIRHVIFGTWRLSWRKSRTSLSHWDKWAPVWWSLFFGTGLQSFSQGYANLLSFRNVVTNISASHRTSGLNSVHFHWTKHIAWCK